MIGSLYKVAHSFFPPCKDQEQERTSVGRSVEKKVIGSYIKRLGLFLLLAKTRSRNVQSIWYNDGTITATGV